MELLEEWRADQIGAIQPEEKAMRPALTLPYASVSEFLALGEK